MLIGALSAESLSTAVAFVPHYNSNNGRRKALVVPTLFSSSSDATIIDNSSNSNDINAIDKAQELREKARALRLEAINAEQVLRNSMQQKKDATNMEADKWIDLLLGSAPYNIATIEESASTSNKNNQTLSLRIKENGLYSATKLQKIVERLHERETAMIMGPEGVLSKQGTSIDKNGSVGGGFVLGDESNSVEFKQGESDKICGLLNGVLEAVQLLDNDKEGGEVATTTEGDGSSTQQLASKLRVRVGNLRQSRDALIQMRVDNLTRNSNNNVKRRSGSKKNSMFGFDSYVQSSVNGDTNSDEKEKEAKMLSRLIESPDWLPRSLAAFAATSPDEVTISDCKMIKEMLIESGFECSSWDSTDVAAVFHRKKLPRRALTSSGDDEKGSGAINPITSIFADIQTNLSNHTELQNKVQIFLVDDNEWRPQSYDTTAGSYGGARGGGWDSSEEKGPPPVIIALAKSVVPEQESERGMQEKSTAAISMLLTVISCLAYGLSFYAYPTFFNAVEKGGDIRAVGPYLPSIVAGVLIVSVLHELGHSIAAKKHGVRLGKPIPLPSLQLGTFGSITPFRSFPSTKAAMFDTSLGGPGTAMLISIILMISGLTLTISSQALANLPIIPAGMLKSSFLVGSIVSVVAPKLMLVPLSQSIPIHPFFLVGLSGIVMSALNMLPIGRLDGGRAFMAVFDRRLAAVVSFTSLCALVFYSFSSNSGVAIFFGLLVVLTQQRFADIPCVDEVTEVGQLRLNSYIVVAALALLTLIPFPGGVGIL